ncbi:MAG TPA: hypothetical protein VHZ03_12130 [Trebonia sp.]|nr:hypothetical protein [Trebonia sp.]
MRKFIVTGLVALAAVLGFLGAVTSPASGAVSGAVSAAVSGAASSTAASAPSSSAGVAASPLSRVVSGTRPGALPAPRSLAYPAGVPAAVPAPEDVLNGVSCLSQGDCLAVGANYAANGGHGSPRAYLWTGSAWALTSVPLPSNTSGGSLIDVSCKGGDCLAVGVYFRGSTQYLLGEHWNGQHWTVTLPPYISGSKFPVPTVVSCATATYCVASGQYNPASNTHDAVAFAEVWNGTSWRLSVPAQVSPYHYEGFFTVSCTGTTFCLLGGEYATSDQGYFTTLVERFNGTNWALVTDAALRPQSGYATYLNSISCTSSVACTAVGEQDKFSGALAWHGFAETFKGGKWTRSTAGLPATSTPTALNAVSCATSTYCVAVGGAGTYAHQTTGKAIFSIWNGSTWTLHYADPPSGQGNYLVDDQCLTTTYCVASGAEGAYNTSTTHGLTWFWSGSKFTLINTA